MFGETIAHQIFYPVKKHKKIAKSRWQNIFFSSDKGGFIVSKSQAIEFLDDIKKAVFRVFQI